MKYLRLEPGDIRGIRVTIPVVFKIGDEEFTGLLDGTVDASNTQLLKDIEKIEER